MVNSRRIAKKVEAFDDNVNKRGNVPTSLIKKESKYAVGPALLVIFIFVVIGSGEKINI